MYSTEMQKLLIQMRMMGYLLYADFRTVLSCRPAGGSNGFHDREKDEVLDRIVCFNDALGSLIRALFAAFARAG
jgi:hypothetical protein